ncbi:hypothetical protein YC2023_084665 [Brassica napus]
MGVSWKETTIKLITGKRTAYNKGEFSIQSHAINLTNTSSFQSTCKLVSCQQNKDLVE